ncbi:tricarballylate utilization 4Fe-4S protein TcuB [Motiliproteus coralliicola]|uniref:Tricarballylate utilization 4Fe-4S protein TcuB n=1 Tax=Motiliproteus coralliicola TaxID=2283196 RepID=A0A369WCR9_9GAMM|nr:tricarballylate utilization 4Fe-4S protein TcuB [Motiliproteus coralliicola]RDE19828.1 tricarballylate utilization 4Fe-4S protein TcuB [Motiliproteus coralliicola]
MQAIELINLESESSPFQALDPLQDARRQLEICNACRYCEGYCSVFPAVHRARSFSDGDIQQLANLCHNCRGCYYACQYTEPHEFDLNVPRVLAEVRQQSWQDHTPPSVMARAFHRHGSAIAVLSIVAMALLLWLMQTGADHAEGFYGLLSHNAMVAIFLPAFGLPLVAIGIGLRRYWRTIGGEKLRLSHLKDAFASAAQMKNLAGGHGDGCNFEDKDRFSHARRHFHQATMIGFLLCFGATGIATLMHYLLNLPAPYSLASLPKLFGISGGVLLSVGTLGLGVLKLKAERHLADARVWGGEMAFIGLLFAVSSTGLALVAAAGTDWLTLMLAIHLGSVLTLFVLMPFSKMVHGFYRLAALIREAQLKPH